MFRRSKKGLGLKEILEICVGERVPPEYVSHKVPQGVRENATFVIDLKNSSLSHRDLSADDNGIFSRHSSPTEKVEVKFKSDGTVETVCPDISCEDHVYLVRRQYSWHDKSKNFSRVIYKVENKGVLTRYAIVQYKASGDVTDLFLKSHGNSKKKDEPYYRVKPSVLLKAKEAALRSESPKHIISLIEKESGGVLNIDSPSEMLRNREQVYNVCRGLPERKRCRNTGPPRRTDFVKLMNLMQHDDFLRDVSFDKKSKKGVEHIAPRTFAATDEQITWIKTYCPGYRPKSQIGIDMTYNVGRFYVTTLAFPHPMFVYRNKPDRHPTVLAAMMTSITKDTEDYEYLAAFLSRKGVKSLTYGTDGELALEQGFENVYPINASSNVAGTTGNIHLRCFTHVETDIKAKLAKTNVSSCEQKKVCSQILGTEKDGIRIRGLVDCENNEAFDSMLLRLRPAWPAGFSQWLDTQRGRLRPLSATLKHCMMKPVRVSAGLGNPPNKWHNQRTEAMHNVLKEEAHGEIIDQARIHEIVNERIVQQQKSEFVKALRGIGEYRLALDYSNLAIDPVRWAQMTPQQRSAYVKKAIGFSLKDEKQKYLVFTCFS